MHSVRFKIWVGLGFLPEFLPGTCWDRPLFNLILQARADVSLRNQRNIWLRNPNLSQHHNSLAQRAKLFPSPTNLLCSPFTAFTNTSSSLMTLPQNSRWVLWMWHKMKVSSWGARLVGNCRMFACDTEDVGWWHIDCFPCFWLTSALNDNTTIYYLTWKSRTKNERCSRYKGITWLPLWEAVGFFMVLKGMHVQM